MKFLKYLSVFLLLGCGSPKVVFDYDTKTNFNQYKTFDFFEDIGEGLNELDVKRIRFELTGLLRKNGLEHSETPDFYINVISKVTENNSRNTIGVGVGGSNRNIGVGISGGIPLGGGKLNQQLTIDFVESKNNKLIWQAISESSIKEQTTPEERNLYYRKILAKVLEGYPPKK